MNKHSRSGGERSVRVAEQIHHELAQMIAREVKDPRIGMVTLTTVDITPDYAYATIHFTVLPDDEATVARSLEGLHCLSPSGLPIEEPHLPADLAELERAMLDGRRVLKLPHHLLRLTTINPDNVGETLGTLLSALAVQADAPHTSWQLSWTPVQKRPTPKHALSLLRHMSRYI